MSESGSWIFQSSPVQYDLPLALEELTELTWLVNQYKNEIHEGDQVFLWETGQAAGVVALAHVLTEPAMLEETADERRYWRVRGASLGPRLRVRLAIETVLRPRLRKTEIQTDPILTDLPNLRFANATNFRLTAEQAAGLLDAIGRHGASTPPPLTAGDFQVLADHPKSQAWDELPEGDRTAYGSLRSKLLAYAEWLTAALSARTPLKAFASHPNPSGRNPLYLWCCVYPQTVPNKSYGFQLLLIVKPDTVEFGFSAGSASGGSSSEADLETYRAALDRARARLRNLTNDRIVGHVIDQALTDGYGLRGRWLRERTGETIASFSAWVDQAASSAGGGGAITRFWSRDEVLTIGAAFPDRLRRELQGFVPLLDAIYAPSETTAAAWSNFDPQWLALCQYLEAHRSWESLSYHFRYDVVSIAEDRIRFRNRDGNEADATKDRLARLWHGAVSSPQGVGIPYDTRARPALLALLPNIEFTDSRIFFVDPPSHVLGEPRRHEAGAGQAPGKLGGGGPEPARVTIEQLSDELCLEPAYLRDVEWLLRDRKQLVFYGPPGTGKTYVAEAFAAWFAGSQDRTETIQFHPSYAYEDFVEGIRPILDADELRYTRADGLLRRFAERARADPEHSYVLVIDEINRANLARVFGELLYLLEYRTRSVRLPYSQELFWLPENLHFIGTMNTADRSIALVDFALRRRFHFIEFPADAAILGRWLAKHNPTMAEAAALLGWVNRQIGDRDFAIGFSYFMRDDLDEALLRRIWERSVLPALDEFYFADQAKRERFRLDRVRAALKAIEPVAEVDTDAVPADGDGQPIVTLESGPGA